MRFMGLLTLLLVAAKLFGFVSYSWLVVFAPTLIVIGFFGLLFITGVFVVRISSR